MEEEEGTMCNEECVGPRTQSTSDPGGPPQHGNITRFTQLANPVEVTTESRRESRLHLWHCGPIFDPERPHYKVLLGALNKTIWNNFPLEHLLFIMFVIPGHV